LETAQGTFHAEQVLACLPAYQLAELLADEHADVSHLLKNINYAPISVRYAAYDREQVSHPLNGFGALHNHLENRYTLGSIFSSTIFPEICPKDEVLLTTFIGGALYPERAMAAETEIKEGINRDYADLLGIEGAEKFNYLKRWPRGIPQYDAAIAPAQEAAAQLEQQGLLLGGNWRGGISVPNCIAQGKRLAEATLANLE
jgi:oxygen-dependent protoporphyrinogen oxidase